MSSRHWAQICEVLQSSFDPTSAEFTLEKIISLELDKYADRICEITGAACKELSIEQVCRTVFFHQCNLVRRELF